MSILIVLVPFTGQSDDHFNSGPPGVLMVNDERPTFLVVFALLRIFSSPLSEDKYSRKAMHISCSFELVSHYSHSNFHQEGIGRFSDVIKRMEKHKKLLIEVFCIIRFRHF